MSAIRHSQIDSVVPTRPATAAPAIPRVALRLWSSELNEVLQAFLDQLRGIVDCDACAFLLLEGDVLHVAAGHGFSSPALGDRFDLGQQPGLRQLLADGLAVVLSDIGPDSPFAMWAGSGGMRAGVAAPMIHVERAVGLILLLKHEPDYYSHKDGQWAMALAHQAAMALENARLHAESRRRARQLEAVSQVSHRVASILEVDALIVQVVHLIRETFGHYQAHIFLVDGRAQEIVLRECSGPADEALKRRGLRLKIGVEGITGWVAASGEALICNDVSQEPRYHPDELLPGTRSELAVPLRLGDVVVGVLDVQSEHLEAFHEDDCRAFQILADQVAIAVENANLFEQTGRQYEAMRVLHNISLEIASRLDTDEVLAEILKQAVRFLRAKGSSLALLDPATQLVRLVAIHNLPPEYQGVTLQLGEGAAGYSIATGSPLIVNDYQQWAARSPIFQNSPFDAIVSVPLRWEAQVFGSLNVIDIGKRRPFHEEDAQLLSLFGDLVSIALKNAELYGQVKQAGEVLEQTVESRTRELTTAKAEIAQKADELSRLLALTVRVQEEERTRIALDLHDGSNQLITGTLFELQAAQESLRASRAEAAVQKLEIAKGLLRSIEAENRRIISGLRPPILDAQGLIPALKWHAGHFRETYGLACAVRITGKPSRLPPETEVAIFRIVQEAMNNVGAHAKARNVNVIVEGGPRQLRVVVEDDGVGFDYQGALGAPRGHMGLVGMRERARGIGGHLDVRSTVGRGTKVRLDVPVSAYLLASDMPEHE